MTGERSSVLVTGASGFIGRALVQRLSADSVQLVAAVRGAAPDLPPHTRVFAGAELAHEVDWTSILRQCDAVVHAAGRAHILAETDPRPIDSFRRVNTRATLLLAQQAAASGVRRFVYISSVGVNGNATSRPFREDDEPRPVEPYAMSKSEAEEGLRSLSRQTGLEVVIVRPPLVYGPGVPGNFRRLLSALARGVPLPLGAVRNQRSFVGITNLVDFVAGTLGHPAAANEVFLISDGEDVSTTELIRRTAGALGRRARLVPVPPAFLKTAARVLGKQKLAQQLLGSLQVDASKARQLLGWSPVLSLDAELRRTAEWYLAHHSRG